MRGLIDLFERAATPTGCDRFVGKTGRIFYIDHREEGGSMVHCHAFAAATSAYEPLRRKAGVASCVMVERPTDLGRNGVNVFSSHTFVDPEFRREGLLNAMYDHLTNHGYIVHPANGEVGDKALQAQSDDARKFWAARNSRQMETKLTPASEDARHGWRASNPFATPSRFGDMPVLGHIKLPGYQFPMCVLWQKEFKSGQQMVGIMYDPERGYRVACSIVSPEFGEQADLPYVDGRAVKFYYASMHRFVKASTYNMVIKIADMVEARTEAS